MPAQLLSTSCFLLSGIALHCPCHWLPGCDASRNLRVTVLTVAYLPTCPLSPHRPVDAVTAFVILLAACLSFAPWS
ncbi:hypothetical protein HBI56_014830 [Parastagonospora nodorum]|uniref:Uncharacterized protein n=1 Tax=Phaeosphaeria nodorum (strain SN15 / ATCC MYA-4574 / FGSC 10173) TaxID=321614 RepID=A0A7U2HYS1_PHANO|nr:hypothetical protein HBH56_085150 [Parastagonospora nodorum]QRC96870.1 hypothetical protein JI435_409730 [Parastagonospora nodorum SN15]KAH3929972.1 hypothetical protein HBH54_116690 [Parastagonospora nodorum]KAH3955748.1 hypothetical protein HBH53_007900 [Parastagonospora nodorum]KAH3976990.1 hypothetical protein HBH51_073620 [Parastagonospora nodorum]